LAATASAILVLIVVNVANRVAGAIALIVRQVSAVHELLRHLLIVAVAVAGAMRLYDAPH